MRSKEHLRQEAVRRRLSGESIGSIAAALKMTGRWVLKWLGRYDPTDAIWYEDRSRAPHRRPRQTPEVLEALIVSIRQDLEARRHAQTGAGSILWTLAKLDYRPLPSTRTVNRVLKRQGLVKQRTSYTPKGTAYPQPPAAVPNALHQVDRVGPRYLRDDGQFYSLNTIDLGRRKVALYPCRRRTDDMTVAGLTSAWQRLGIPQRAQFDNELAFWGSNRYPRSFGTVIRMCLHLGVEPVFIPLDEPWRNGIIERFQAVWDQRFFRTQQFVGFGHVEEASRQFEVFHNTHHRYSALKGRTPNEVERLSRFQPQLLPQDFIVPKERPRHGRIHLIRLIRSDRILRVASERFRVDPALIHEYVTATVVVEEEVIEVRHVDRLVQTIEYRLPK